jgi:hypothetical protein
MGSSSTIIREVKNENGSTLNYRDLFIGCKLRILKHMFLLLDANESTLKWMENNTAILNLPRSSYYAILDKIRPLALSDAKSGELTKLFQEQVHTYIHSFPAIREKVFLICMISLYDRSRLKEGQVRLPSTRCDRF